jgi:hypothetical protein
VELLDKCLESIRNIYQDHQIIIVDSNSPKKDHFPGLCERYNAHVAYKVNTNYECGAWKIVYEECKADFYCCIHDSCYLVRPLDTTFDDEVSSYTVVDNTPKGWFGECAGLRKATWESLVKTKWEVPEQFWTMVGNIIFAKVKIFDLLYNNGFFDILPTNKFEACCWERRIGLCLTCEGYGDMLVKNQIGAWQDNRPADRKVFKKWLNRQ